MYFLLYNLSCLHIAILTLSYWHCHEGSSHVFICIIVFEASKYGEIVQRFNFLPINYYAAYNEIFRPGKHLLLCLRGIVAEHLTATGNAILENHFTKAWSTELFCGGPYAKEGCHKQ